jgi:hypothetical protein
MDPADAFPRLLDPFRVTADIAHTQPLPKIDTAKELS